MSEKMKIAGVLAECFFHDLPEEDDWEVHDPRHMSDGGCDECVPAVIVSRAEWQARGSQPVGVPDGYAMVPVEPTVEMRQAFYTELNSRGVWRAMLAAAPTVKAEQAGREVFRAHLSECADEVEKWPEWKRNALGNQAPVKSPDLRDEVELMVSALEDGEWAEHVGQTELGARLESVITTLINRLPAHSLPAAGLAVESWRDQILRENPKSEPAYWPDALIVAAMGREIEHLRAALSAQQSAPERVGVPVVSEYPKVGWAKRHKHTCANVQPGATSADKCDCGAVDHGKSREAIERAIHFLQAHAPSMDCAEWDTADELRALLSGAREGGA